MSITTRISNHHFNIDGHAIFDMQGLYQVSSHRSSLSNRHWHPQVRNFINQNRNTPRLDIDHMSYEEVLLLQERMGTVRTGLSEENISSCLKTRIHIPSATSSRWNPSAAANKTCVICQAEYEKWEKIGTLRCGHGYHVNCIKQWLLLNNICPICRRPALTH